MRSPSQNASKQCLIGMKNIQIWFQFYQTHVSTLIRRLNIYVLTMRQIERDRIIHTLCFTELLET